MSPDSQRKATPPVRIVGLIANEYYFKAAADGGDERLYRIDSPTPRDDVSGEQPETTAQMSELAFGLYEAARYMRYHNSPEAVVAQRERAASGVGAGPQATRARGPSKH